MAGIDRAIEIIQNLADGVDPYSGKQFASGFPCQQDNKVRALHWCNAGSVPVNTL